MDRYDALTVREKDGRSYFTKIGAAFPNKDGKGFTILLDAVPASLDGQYKIMLREPLPPRDGGRAVGDQRNTAPADLDDDVPF